MKQVLFVALYLWACFKFLLLRPLPPFGAPGKLVFRFRDPDYPGLHGVVAFPVPPNWVEELSPDLYGPMGFSSQISLKGYHLYGRDTWGMVTEKQIEANPDLQDLVRIYPHHPILLAGTRQFLGHHIWPLNDPSRYVLTFK